jgi:hypothetical protein
MTEDIQQRDGRADFDFLVGQWRVHHRILWQRLKGSTSWEEVEGTAVNYKMLGGLGNIEHHLLDRDAGRVEAIALRIFNPGSQEWSIYWADSVATTLDAGVFGGFERGQGAFYAQEVFEGRHLLNRFLWSDITPTSARWEQAFSADGGKTWEVNWIMQFRRNEQEPLSGFHRGRETENPGWCACKPQLSHGENPTSLQVRKLS